MYAVIKTGGKQYRVQPGDLLVVEKLDGEPGADVAFGDVLMVGDGDSVTLGAPLVDGASVSATLIETRKGEKVKIFKKIRRQGYRRTRGHRQLESVLRVTAVAGAGKTDKWDGEVDLTPKAVLDARARNLKLAEPAPVEAKPAKAAPKKAAAPKADADEAPAAEAKTAAPKKAAAPKAEAGEKKAAPKKAAAKKESDAE
ncbi:50S ribosomal protein L21 [Phenylobacterium sp.]|uniref:50S ribosomal protein L21 n=1 Tax=Phenylobacterium sp. TaxID=1871053 RepID=UPI0019838A9C|nr:50S ribosomal protein L21 [Phenylobacterium sp.]MBC7166045.1 50S ribosomal protein L21 [Phenylobacterium sp.]